MGRGDAGSVGGDDADEAAHAAAVLEAHLAGRHGEQGVVLAAPHVPARLDGRAALPDEDGPPFHVLAVEGLTPSRCALESRPFLELPPAFLCAIYASIESILTAV